MSNMNNALSELQKVFPDSSISVEIGPETSKGISVIARINIGSSGKPAITLTSLFQEGNFASVRDEALETALSMAGVTSCFSNGESNEDEGSNSGEGNGEDSLPSPLKLRKKKKTISNPKASSTAVTAEAGEATPAAETVETTPAAEAGETTPAAETGEGAPAAETGEGAPAAETGEGAPAAETGEGAPAAENAGKTNGSDEPDEDKSEVLFAINTEGALAADVKLIREMKKLCGQSVVELVNKNKLRVKCMFTNASSRKYMTEETRMAIRNALAGEE